MGEYLRELLRRILGVWTIALQYIFRAQASTYHVAKGTLSVFT